MKNRKNFVSKVFVAFFVALAFGPALFAQAGSSVEAGAVTAYNFAYGGASYGKFSAPPPLSVGMGNTATGAGNSITLTFGNLHTNDGITFMPLSVNAPIIVGSGTNAETVTPTAVSCGTPAILNTCTVTANFANLHGIGDLVASGSYGIQEAALYQYSLGGGVVWVTRAVPAVSGKSIAATRTYLHTLLGCNLVSLATNIGDATAAAFSFASTAGCGGTWTVWTQTAVSWY